MPQVTQYAPDVDGIAAGGRTGWWTSGVRKMGSVVEGTECGKCSGVGEGTVGCLGSALTFDALAIASSLLE